MRQSFRYSSIVVLQEQNKFVLRTRPKFTRLHLHNTLTTYRLYRMLTCWHPTNCLRISWILRRDKWRRPSSLRSLPLYWTWSDYRRYRLDHCIPLLWRCRKRCTYNWTPPAVRWRMLCSLLYWRCRSHSSEERLQKKPMKVVYNQVSAGTN